MDSKMDLFKYYKFPFKCCPDHLIDSEEQLLATIHNKYKKNYYFVSIRLALAIGPVPA